MGVQRVTDAPVGAAVFEAVGENDGYDADRLQQALEDARSTATGVVVDLSRAVFVDSTFVGVLLVQSKVREQRLAVVVPDEESNAVARLFAMAHLAEALDVHHTRDAALDAVGDHD